MVFNVFTYRSPGANDRLDRTQDRCQNRPHKADDPE